MLCLLSVFLIFFTKKNGCTLGGRGNIRVTTLDPVQEELSLMSLVSIFYSSGLQLTACSQCTSPVVWLTAWEITGQMRGQQRAKSAIDLIMLCLSIFAWGALSNTALSYGVIVCDWMFSQCSQCLESTTIQSDGQC